MNDVRSPTTFGPQLRSLREARGMPLPTFASALALSRPYVSQIEHGHRHPLPLSRLRVARNVLSLTNAEFTDLVTIAAQEHVLTIAADDFTKPREALALVALLAAYDRQIPRDFFARTRAWIEAHCR